MRREFNNIVSVAYTAIRFAILKILNGKNFNCCVVERFSPNVVVEVNRGAQVKFGKQVRVHSGSKIKVRKDASLHIGDNVKINYNCIIACHDKIEIGAGTEFGPSVYLYDHDHDYKAGLKKQKFKTLPIKIGNNCWIGANTIILKGTQIEDNSIVGAGSIIKGTYPAKTVIVQKRETTVKCIEGE